MARTGEMTVRAIERLQRSALPGRYRVAPNLFLLHRPPRRSWTHGFTCPLSRVEHEMGLGPTDLVSVLDAKATVLRYRLMEHAGRCPLCERRRVVTPRRLPFSEVVALYIQAHRAGWRHAETERQWSTLHQYTSGLWALPVAAIDTGAVMSVLAPRWNTLAATLNKTRARIEAILDFAAARGWRPSEIPNPARWKGHLANLLPKPAKLKPLEHHAALPWAEASAFWATLAPRTDIWGSLIQFIVLTAARRSEARLAQWSEIDRDNALWIVPGCRMKSGREHRVPLSAPALALLDRQAAVRRNDFIFPAATGGNRPAAENPIRATLVALRPGVTLHGFRATFRTWAAEAAHARQDVAEAALAHVTGSQTELAYQRGDLLCLRAALMDQWAGFLSGEAQP
jgi:integrase